MIVGRKRQQRSLEKAFNKKESQFVTVYGRRRVGKTYLIKEFFSQKDCIFLHVTGKQHGKIKQQLEAFRRDAFKAFPIEEFLYPLKSWGEAFRLLNREIDRTDRKVVLFFDELPWLATARSELLDEIDHYWNNKWAWNKHVIFVACGSSASWILTNIIFNTGGLHNRTTLEIHLRPFNLAETKEYLQANGIKLSNRHILSLYMAVGGIPYYLNYIEPGLSVQQNIQQLFFDPDAPLVNEYYQLFDSLFKDSEGYRELFELIAEKREGVSAESLADDATLSSSGGGLTEKLRRLCQSSFIEKYVPWKTKRQTYYKVIDEFCLFYLYWVKKEESTRYTADHWLLASQRPRYYSWSGYAFEALCSKHYQQVIHALGLINVKEITSWRYIPTSDKERGVQLDLVLPRYDDAITLCEVKYTDAPFAIDKRYAHILKYQVETFQKKTKTKSQLFLAMISANGLKQNTYSDELINAVVTLDDLFKEY